jgi:2-keto-3-deoxy-L-rhamnonate aldolase RhmA
MPTSADVSSFAGPRGMVGAARLKRRVAAGAVTTGIGCTEPVPTAIVELAIRAGIDFMYVTMEHGHHSERQVAEMAAIARRLDWVLMIRPVDSAPATLRKCMDLGCSGLVLPNIESAAELDRVRDAIWLPPRGTRRPGGAGNHWVADFQYKTWKAQVEDHFIVLPMIESTAGLANVAEIAAHELVTHVDIGPYDLALSLGIDYYSRPPPGEHDPLAAAVITCREAAATCGKVLLGAWGEPEEMLAAGDHFMMVAEPTALLSAALTAQNQKVKPAPPDPATPVYPGWQLVTREPGFPGMDGAGALVHRDRMWLLGGWNPADLTNFPPTALTPEGRCNSRVYSSADGVVWALECAEAPWQGRHTAGYAVFEDRMWIIGGDVQQQCYQNDVWSSEDGKKWTCHTADAPWGNRCLHHALAFDGALWVIGGQTSYEPHLTRPRGAVAERFFADGPGRLRAVKRP